MFKQKKKLENTIAFSPKQQRILVNEYHKARSITGLHQFLLKNSRLHKPYLKISSLYRTLGKSKSFQHCLIQIECFCTRVPGERV